VITGFLGAGKTTLIKRLLKAPHGLQIGLVLNEIGQAGIDQVPEAESAYVELTEGCACCVRNPDLIAALQEIGQRDDIDRILLETSGLADPLPLSWSLTHPELSPLVQLDAVIVALDARFRGEAADEEWQAQVRSADLAVLTKQDLASPEAIAAVQAEALGINPQLRFVDPADPLAEELLLDVDVDTPRAHELERAHARHSNFGGFIIAGPEQYALDPLEDLLEALPPEVFRVKGIVPLDTGEWAAFHVVGGRVQMELDVAPPTHGEGRIALFGRALDEAKLRGLVAVTRGHA
jgi:G3E family GTPase